MFTRIEIMCNGNFGYNKAVQNFIQLQKRGKQLKYSFCTKKSLRLVVLIKDNSPQAR